ncbi:hypothetical protein [Proteiniphilum sp.]|uniref:hypothetical protein n=1 Tax=Proteiniphilum sp. TaxID=1926877 RepID=UPI002B1FBF27|nr:hypothetical protein [Proteiniphilum sp.]MEA4917495.1 hypothetical protein [Proteiniphilum sp.]MEA4950710.1 hypothetical protein [Petrimonas sp.]
MELDELKNIWAQLETKMNEHGLLKEKILKAIYKNRYNKSLSQLINYTFLSCILALLGIILLIYRISVIYFGPFKMTMFILAITFILCGFIIGITNLKLLYKIDYSKSVSHNMQLTRKYQIRIKRQSLATYISVIILVILAIIASILSSNMELWRWITIGGTIIVGIMAAIWEYKRMYKKNINSILESLDELKELEED